MKKPIGKSLLIIPIIVAMTFNVMACGNDKISKGNKAKLRSQLTQAVEVYDGIKTGLASGAKVTQQSFVVSLSESVEAEEVPYKNAILQAGWNIVDSLLDAGTLSTAAVSYGVADDAEWESDAAKGRITGNVAWYIALEHITRSIIDKKDIYALRNEYKIDVSLDNLTGSWLPYFDYSRIGKFTYPTSISFSGVAENEDGSKEVYFTMGTDSWTTVYARSYFNSEADFGFELFYEWTHTDELGEVYSNYGYFCYDNLSEEYFDASYYWDGVSYPGKSEQYCVNITCSAFDLTSVDEEHIGLISPLLQEIVAQFKQTSAGLDVSNIKLFSATLEEKSVDKTVVGIVLDFGAITDLVNMIRLDR